MAAEREERRYTLEPLDGSGVFLGLSPLQCGLLGGGITVSVFGITAGLPGVLALVPLVVAGVASFARLGGHPMWEWLPLGAGWAWGRLRGRRRWLAPLPLVPVDVGGTPQLPPCLSGLEVWDVAWRGPFRLAAVHDRHRQTLTALFPVSGPQFVLEPAHEQERLLTGWGDALAQFAVDGGPVSQVFWSDLVCPTGVSTDAMAGDDPAGPTESYRQLLGEAAATASAHETVVGITVSRDRLRRDGSGDLMERTLVTAVDGLMRCLQAAGLTVDDPLDVLSVYRLLRHRIDPLASAALLEGIGSGLADRLGLVQPASAGPLALETTWRQVRVDAAWHRTWWVAAWPRSAMPPAWLEPFLSTTGIARTMTVAFVPVAAHRSRRTIERDLVKLESDAAAKQDKGRRIDARHERATQALLDREAELVAGYAEMAYVGLVSVAARSASELDQQSEVVEHMARQAGMELRVLDGRQDVAWAAALPLGLAPRTLVGT